MSEAWTILTDLRAEGWSVAAHNDYVTDDGRPMVFWMMTHPTGVWEKANGQTDTEALQKIASSATAIDLRNKDLHLSVHRTIQENPEIFKVSVSIRGNCGQIHTSENEWRNCRACDTPRPTVARDPRHDGRPPQADGQALKAVADKP